MANHKLDTDTQVFIYEAEFYPLSNFSSFRIFWRDLNFDTSEHAYHWEKFWEHPEIQEAILATNSAHEAFKLAQKYKDLVDPGWADRRVSVMTGILMAKTAQHEYVKKKLMETGDREIIEDSWRDDLWGWGPNKDGKNMLGKLWMAVREYHKVHLADSAPVQVVST